MAAAAAAGEPGERLSSSPSLCFLLHFFFRQLGSVITYLLSEKLLPMWDEHLPVFHCYEITCLNCFRKAVFQSKASVLFQKFFPEI